MNDKKIFYFQTLRRHSRITHLTSQLYLKIKQYIWNLKKNNNKEMPIERNSS